MKILPKLKEKLMGAKTMEEKKEVLKEVGLELTDEEIQKITGGSEPLMVIDGVPFRDELQDINPSDIESMNILKDASSTAIYGNRK